MSQWIIFFQPARKADGDNSDRDGGFEHLAYLEAEISRSGTEYHSENKAGSDRVDSNFLVLAGRMHHRTVLFVLAQFDESVFGKVYGVDILDRYVVVLV